MPQTIDAYSDQGGVVQQLGINTTDISGIYFDGLYMWVTDNESGANVMVKQYKIRGDTFDEQSSFDIDTVIGGGVTRANGITGDGKNLYVAYEYTIAFNVLTKIGRFNYDGDDLGEVFSAGRSIFGRIRDITYNGNYLVLAVTASGTHNIRLMHESGNVVFTSGSFSRPVQAIAWNGKHYRVVTAGGVATVDINGNILDTKLGAAASGQLKSATFSEPASIRMGQRSFMGHRVFFGRDG